MIKKTLHFGNPVYLSTQLNQLLARFPQNSQTDKSSYNERFDKEIKIPIEDIGIIILDHPQISITHGALAALLENNAAVVTSDNSHMPVGLFLSLDGNTLQNERFRAQLSASEPLKKQIWQQTIQAKIRNQAALLDSIGVDSKVLKIMANDVRSGDPDNKEAHAAAWYWPRVFVRIPGFSRSRTGQEPNNWLNYGYAILRATVARNLVGSGLLPTLGIHHANKYNAYCLADDIMEPYRPFVDAAVIRMLDQVPLEKGLEKKHKAQLLQIPVMDVIIGNEKSPLMVAVQRTTASLARCFYGETRKVLYPSF